VAAIGANVVTAAQRARACPSNADSHLHSQCMMAAIRCFRFPVQLCNVTPRFSVLLARQPYLLRFQWIVETSPISNIFNHSLDLELKNIFRDK
jgi:hypothetical protein